MQLSPGELAAIKNLLALVGALHGRFGRMRVVKLAVGSDDDARFDDLPERGCLRGWRERAALDLVRALEGAGLVEASRGEYPTIALSRRGSQVAAGKLDAAALDVQMPSPGKQAKAKRSRKR
jgi:hypothetical protein